MNVQHFPVESIGVAVAHAEPPIAADVAAEVPAEAVCPRVAQGMEGPGHVPQMEAQLAAEDAPPTQKKPRMDAFAGDDERHLSQAF